MTRGATRRRVAALEYTAIAFFLPSILSQFLGTGMFWVVAVSAVTPIVFLLIVRHEPTARDIDAEAAV